MTIRKFHGAALLAALLVPCLAAAVTLISPDQTRSVGSDAVSNATLCYTAPYDPLTTCDPPQPIAVCPGMPGGTCPIGGIPGGLIDTFGEIQNNTPTVGGSCLNPDGDGIIGYMNFGATDDVLVCGVGNPFQPVRSCFPTTLKDITTFFRFKLPAAGSSGGAAWKSAVLEITPAMPRTANAFWPSISVSTCQIPANGAWTANPGFTPFQDSEGQVSVADPGDPNPVDPDCIVTNRNGGPGIGLGYSQGLFDVVSNTGNHNPADGQHVGGVANLSFAQGFTKLTGNTTIKIVLNQIALDLINAGGQPAGYLELTVNMGEDRAAESEGPNATRANWGLPDGVNALLIEDQTGCSFDPSVITNRVALTQLALGN